MEPPLTECWLSPVVRVGSSSIEGQGLFAARTIPAGTVVSRFGGRLLSDAELRDLLDNSPTYVDTLSIGHDVNLVLPPDVPNHAGNHGCDPNGATSCRQRVTGRDWELPELRNAYGLHWVPVLRQRIAEG